MVLFFYYIFYLLSVYIKENSLVCSFNIYTGTLLNVLISSKIFKCSIFKIFYADTSYCIHWSFYNNIKKLCDKAWLSCSWFWLQCLQCVTDMGDVRYCFHLNIIILMTYFFMPRFLKKLILHFINSDMGVEI